MPQMLPRPLPLHRRLTLTIDPVSFERLAALAQAERRPVRDQAAVLVERGRRRVPAEPRRVRSAESVPTLPGAA